MTTVTTLRSVNEPSRKAKTASKKEPRSRRRAKQDAMSGNAIGVCALILVVLSLNHLSHGIVIVTNAPMWEAIALAIGLDLGFISFELGLLTAPTEKIRTKRAVWARPAIIGLLVFSAVLNALAFAHASTGYLVYPAAFLGLAIPAVIYAMARTGASIWMDYRAAPRA